VKKTGEKVANSTIVISCLFMYLIAPIMGEKSMA